MKRRWFWGSEHNADAETPWRRRSCDHCKQSTWSPPCRHCGAVVCAECAGASAQGCTCEDRRELQGFAGREPVTTGPFGGNYRLLPALELDPEPDPYGVGAELDDEAELPEL